ncbi:hypothetical protein EHM92_07415 [bacterium]|nr:MAG: hypothetical protein EHM92_07415 [bacterium]
MEQLWGQNVTGEEYEGATLEQKHGTLRIYLAGAITVGFGAAAAYFKIQADNRNEQLLANLPSSSRAQVRSYDTASAVCLVIAEAGFGFLTYFLLTE